MFSTNILGYKKGPANNIKLKECSLDNDWKIINIPFDIPNKVAINNIKSFLTNISALEIPSSLMCNCNCIYCYIREKNLKNTYISVDSIKLITEESQKNIFKYSKNNEKYISSWGAEPLCNLNTLEYLIDFCIENNYYLNFSTNGTIINKKVEELFYKLFSYYKNNNMKIQTIQISLDGPKDIQDIYRPLYSNESNFENISKFISFLDNLAEQLKINHSLYTFCSTIYLDENCINTYKKSIDFYTNIENKKFYVPILPVRLENSRNFTKIDSEFFLQIIKESTEFLIEKSKRTGEAYLDFYAARIFLNSSRVDGWPRCSAMNTQIAIDIDGSLSMCHGSITTSKLKPLLQFGNVLNKTIDYRKYISSIDAIYSDMNFRSICKTCEIFQFSGPLCIACPPTGLSINEEPVNFNIHMCNIYKKCLPYWKLQYENYSYLNRQKDLTLQERD